MASETALVDKVRCKEHKESWAAGASEVNVIFVTSDYGFYDGEVWVYDGGPHEGGSIYKFSRDQVKNQTLVDLNFFLLENWRDLVPNQDWGSYVVFEYDAYPTGKETVGWTHGGYTYYYEYRSADIYYDKHTEYRPNYEYMTRLNTSIDLYFRYFLNVK
ncbi:MAG: hypothetical protein ACNS60_09390 [Candidatus Cyclobacteriaceae bacterium M2_1C_046]